MTPYYDDGTCTIYHGDCREVLSTLADVDLVVTSPPYNTLSATTITGGGIHKRSSWSAKVRTDGYADDITETDYWSWQALTASRLAAVVRPGGSFFYNHKLRYRDGAPIVPMDYVRTWVGWRLRQEIIWERDGSMVFNARMFPPNDERIYWLVRNGADHQWNQEAGNQWMSVWRIRQVIGVDGHPCPYPAAIPTRCILATTQPGDTVLDPFMGSGTTIRAAKDLGRKAIGIEIEERYCEIAARRIDQGVLDFGASA